MLAGVFLQPPSDRLSGANDGRHKIAINIFCVFVIVLCVVGARSLLSPTFGEKAG